MKINVKKTLLSLLILLIVGVFAYGGYYVYSILNFGNRISDGQSAIDEYERQIREENPDLYVPNEPPTWEGTERVNILLLGGDARGASANSPPRADTIMVVSIDPQTKQSHLFTVMRDAYTDIPGHRKHRINSSLAWGGPKLAMEAVGDYLGLDIQYYVFVDFQGFIGLVDALGGIEFEVERNMYYYDPTDPEYKIDLKKGKQLLDGEKALQYVRFRNDTLGDFTRTERQRNLLAALAKKMTSTTSLINLPNTLRKIEPYISTNLSDFDKMLKLARLAYESSKNELVTAQMPPMHLLREEKIDQMDVMTVNKAALHDYVQELFETAQADPPATAANDPEADAAQQSS